MLTNLYDNRLCEGFRGCLMGEMCNSTECTVSAWSISCAEATVNGVGDWSMGQKSLFSYVLMNKIMVYYGSELKDIL